MILPRNHWSLPAVILGILTMTCLAPAFWPAPTVATKPAAAPQAAGWKLEVKEGNKVRSTLSINNRCGEPHRFRIISKIKYLRFAQPIQSILVGAYSSEKIPVEFDAAGLKTRTYRDKVTVECTDCKKSRLCKQDKDEVPVEMIVFSDSGWCVIRKLSPRLPMKCIVTSVYASKSPTPCPTNSTWPKGSPLPKVGGELALKHCELGPGPNIPIDRRPPISVASPTP